jgi:ATP-dependent protease Clp ATPase subunit
MSTQDPGTQPRTCSFCRQEQGAANALVQGPDGVSICYLCIRGCTEAIRARSAYCSFCCKKHTEVGPLAEGPNWVYICHKCARLCAEIIEQELQRKGSPVERP